MVLIFWFAMSERQIPVLDHMLQIEKDRVKTESEIKNKD